MHEPEQLAQRQERDAPGREPVEVRSPLPAPDTRVVRPVRVPTLPRPAPVPDPQQWLDLCA